MSNVGLLYISILKVKLIIRVIINAISVSDKVINIWYIRLSFINRFIIVTTILLGELVMNEFIISYLANTSQTSKKDNARHIWDSLIISLFFR